MESEDLKNKILPFLRQNLIILVLVVAGLICLSYGLISLLGSSNASDDITIQSQQDNLAGNTSATKIKADIEGAVVKPGVYELNTDSRIQDLLVAGMGLSVTADRDWVAKNLNLAAKLADGAKVYIPSVGEITSTASNQAGSASSGSVTSGSININSASSQELDSLPGVGPATAEKIINNRPYQSLDELVSKKAVGAKVFDSIKDKISLY